MADLMPCPSCGATLRIPAGAEMIRCPQCKTQAKVAKAPVPKGIPLPSGVPLPFDDRSMVSIPPPQAVPVAKALPAKPTARGRVVREEEVQTPARKSRKKAIEEELKQNKNYERVASHCLLGRTGTRIMAFAALTATFHSLLFALFLGTLAIASFTEPTMLHLAIGTLGLHTLLLLIGFGCCCGGPLGMRSTAGIGIGVTLVHLGLIIPIILFGSRLLNAMDTDVVDDKVISRIVFIVSSSLNNMSALTDFLWVTYRGIYVSGDRMYMVLMLLGGLCEFMKMCVLGTIVQYYASEGKSHELGFRSLRFVYRTIWVIAVIGGLKFAVLIAFELFGGEQATREYYRIPQTLLTMAYFLYWAFAWYEQFRAMNETADVITPARFLDHRAYVDDFY